MWKRHTQQLAVRACVLPESQSKSKQTNTLSGCTDAAGAHVHRSGYGSRAAGTHRKNQQPAANQKGVLGSAGNNTDCNAHVSCMHVGLKTSQRWCTSSSACQAACTYIIMHVHTLCHAVRAVSCYAVQCPDWCSHCLGASTQAWAHAATSSRLATGGSSARTDGEKCSAQCPHMPAVYVTHNALLLASAMSALPSFCTWKRLGAVPRPAVLVVHRIRLPLS